MPAPVALFVYRRPEHTARLLASLKANKQSADSTLYVFSDAPACEADRISVLEVRALLRELGGFARVILIEREENFGCAANIIDGLNQVFWEHDRVIVVEDDLNLSPHFLTYMNQALDTYREREEIISISAASPPPRDLGKTDWSSRDVYLAPRSSPWGWATWRDRWAGINWELPRYSYQRWRPEWRRRMARGGSDLLFMLDDQMAGKIDSWNVRFNHAQAMAGSYSLYPRYSYVRNVGLDGSGVHCRASDRHDVKLDQALEESLMPSDIQPEKDLMRAVKAYHDEHLLSLLLGTIPGVRRLIRATKKRLGIDRPLLKQLD